HMRLSGLSTAGRAKAAIRKMAASPAVHGQIRPSCQPFSALTTAKAPAITSPNERSEPATIFSSREKSSWVDGARSDIIPLGALGRQGGAQGVSFGALLCFAVRPGKSKKRLFRQEIP